MLYNKEKWIKHTWKTWSSEGRLFKKLIIPQTIGLIDNFFYKIREYWKKEETGNKRQQPIIQRSTFIGIIIEKMVPIKQIYMK